MNIRTHESELHELYTISSIAAVYLQRDIPLTSMPLVTERELTMLITIKCKNAKQLSIIYSASVMTHTLNANVHSQSKVLQM